ncbi:hypothetical protein EBB07_21600 [Paenibacillaceae bacterium]|nr:hypothetical protein EBB07_21600 [Paenibacillaceae bacterium]
MNAEISRLVFWAALAGQYVLGVTCLWALLQVLAHRRPRWLHLLAGSWQQRQLADKWLRMFGVARSRASFQERAALLIGAGFSPDPALYVIVRQALMVLLPAVALLLYFAKGLLSIPSAFATGGLLLTATLLFCALWDKPLLETLKQLRAQRITREIYVISNQLLYLSGSALNIHTKLMRCLPYARTMRPSMQRMLAEWYHDAEGALRRFKERIGTEEGLSFVETIASLRLHDSEEYYLLLRERIQDYKEKLDLARESRKESASYLLFVLAGVPILYMFQIFIYPWVQEAQKLFESLNQ